MSCYSIVPNNNGASLPFYPSLKVLTERYMVIKEFEKVVAFLLFEADDISGELRVDIQCLLAGRRMSPHDRMDGRNRISSDDTAPVESARGLFVT